MLHEGHIHASICGSGDTNWARSKVEFCLFVHVCWIYGIFWLCSHVHLAYTQETHLKKPGAASLFWISPARTQDSTFERITWNLVQSNWFTHACTLHSKFQSTATNCVCFVQVTVSVLELKSASSNDWKSTSFFVSRTKYLEPWFGFEEDTAIGSIGAPVNKFMGSLVKLCCKCNK